MGTSMMTLRSSGGFLPVGMASIFMDSGLVHRGERQSGCVVPNRGRKGKPVWRNPACPALQRRNAMKPILAAMLAIAALATPAQAAFNSAYTDLDLDECLVLDADDFGARWACPGYKGYPLMVTEG